MAGAAGGDEATVSKEMAGNSFAVSSGRCHRAVLLQCLLGGFGSVFPQCGLMVFPGAVIVSR